MHYSIAGNGCQFKFNALTPHTLRTGQFKARDSVERGSVVSASEFNSEDPGFDPLVGQGEGQFFYPSESIVVQTCLCPPLRVQYGTHPKFVRMLKIPYPSVAKK